MSTAFAIQYGHALGNGDWGMRMSIQAGWYNDGAGAIRYWDGTAWTAHTAARQPAPQHPPTQQPLAAQPYAPQPSVRAAAPPGQAMAPYPAANAGMMPVVPPAPVAARPTNGAGVAGFVVGLISVFLPILFGLVVGVVGLILSIVGLTRPYAGKGLAIAGLVLSIAGILLII